MGEGKHHDDLFDLQRFVDAQSPVYSQVTAELAAGRKASHWMWFVLPQLRALGRSATAKRYGLTSLAEAAAYWHHPRARAAARRMQSIVAADRRPNRGAGLRRDRPFEAAHSYPITGWLLSPMIEALAMSLSSASVIGNALRLRGHG